MNTYLRRNLCSGPLHLAIAGHIALLQSTPTTCSLHPSPVSTRSGMVLERDGAACNQRQDVVMTTLTLRSALYLSTILAAISRLAKSDKRLQLHVGSSVHNSYLARFIGRNPIHMLAES
jgi:hypothetical protein